MITWKTWLVAPRTNLWAVRVADSRGDRNTASWGDRALQGRSSDDSKWIG